MRAWNFPWLLGFTPQIETNAGRLDVAEKNKEIVTLIGRRLREAAESGQASELPDAIRLGLERLDVLDTAIGGSEESGGRPQPKPFPPS
jgi:hypothetical protein